MVFTAPRLETLLMIAIAPTPSRFSASMSRGSLAAIAFTYGQWLQMNMTTSPFGPRAEARVWRLPSTPRRSKAGALEPSAAGGGVAAMSFSSGGMAEW